MSALKKIGFVIDGLVPTFRNCLSHRSFFPIFKGWGGSSSIQAARFNPLISQSYVEISGLQYDLFRPWKRYDAVIFLKSMNDESILLARRCRERKINTIFDLNVDYFSPASGIYYYEGMAPTVEQSEQARRMAMICNAIIADSNWLKSVAQQFHQVAIRIPDIVPDIFFQGGCYWQPELNKPIPLLWSGEAVKLFDLLLIEDVLRFFRKRIILRIITNSLEAIDRIFQPWQEKLKKLLNDLQVEIIPFKSLSQLLGIYDQGGVFISPRFLDNTYNMGHTEWKITLPMARNRLVLCSPQPSYKDVALLSQGKGIRICSTNGKWFDAFNEIMKVDFDWQNEQKTTRDLVKNHYSATVVIKMHVDFMRQVLQQQQHPSS